MKPALERIANALEGILSEMQGNKPDNGIAEKAISDAYAKSLKPQKLDRCEDMLGRVE